MVIIVFLHGHLHGSQFVVLFTLCTWNVYLTDHCLWFATGLSCAVGQLVCLSMPTACTTTTPDQICRVSCKPRSSSVTWLASAMASFSCLGWWVSVRHCSLFAIFTGRSSVSKHRSVYLVKAVLVSLLHHGGRSMIFVRWIGSCRTYASRLLQD